MYAEELKQILSGKIGNLDIDQGLLFAGKPKLHYIFFSTVEIATTIFIVMYAFRWTDPIISINEQS